MRQIKCFWVIVLPVVFVASCSHKQDQNSDNSIGKTDSASITSVQDSVNNVTLADAESDVSTDSEVILPFKEFTIRILNLKLDSPDSKNNLSRNEDSQELQDSVFLTAGLGETVEDKLFEISARSNFTRLTVEQRYETGLGVSTEEWNCEVENWLRFDSEWEPIQKNKDGQYLCRAYSTDERRRFPSFSLTELQKAVDDNCDPKAGAYFREVKSLQEAPFEVYIRSIYIRISGWDEVQKKTISRILVFDSQYGC
ncbi:MAG TPA: hypothetical protein PK509_16215 [Catalimonadaceae bacterium]|nr:hypothetical protein [Catalimonadaceae bacterium]HPI11805.1 hypothetical protein [Catalimonadaceae bacterium]